MSEPAVVTRGLCKRFGSVRAVEQLDLEILPGTIFGLLGPNGAGKSTTFGILCGWLRPTQGEARVLGTPSRRLSRLRGQVTALPQDAAFPPQISVGAQLVHYARLSGIRGRAAHREAGRVLERVGLASALRQPGATLSHGQRKRVGLAQALIGAPRVIFLDEPTSGLDPDAKRSIKDLILELAPEATVVVSSHDLSEIEEMCTHGAILDHGRCIASGTLETLQRRQAEITIEIGRDAAIPWQPLKERFGADRVHAPGPGEIRIEFSDGGDAADAISAALRLLLDAGTPILGVRRGTSLEARYLELTASSRTPPQPR